MSLFVHCPRNIGSSENRFHNLKKLLQEELPFESQELTHSFESAGPTVCANLITVICPVMPTVKVHIIWKGHKILQNIHRRRFDWHYIGQIYGGDFTKFCGLLRTYELYYPPHHYKWLIFNPLSFLDLVLGHNMTIFDFDQIVLVTDYGPMIAISQILFRQYHICNVFGLGGRS